jgi:hypothetical protein
MEKSSLGFIHRCLPAPAGQDVSRVFTLLHGMCGVEDVLFDLGRMLDPGAPLPRPSGRCARHSHTNVLERET